MKHLSIALLVLGLGAAACRSPEDESSSYEVTEGRAVTLAITGMT